jgi:transposase InsO family protein
MGPRIRRSTVLTEGEEQAAVEFRRRTHLPLDDLLGCLRGRIPALSRSALHRCLQRHGVSRLPSRSDGVPKRGRFADTTIGFVHIDSCEVRAADGKLHLFLAVDRVTKFAYVELHPRATKLIGAAFLRGVLAAFPYTLHTVLTDNGTPFADQPRYRAGPTAALGGHPFDRICHAQGITHKLTRPYHPWTNGQAERMVRTIKDATVKAFHYETRDGLAAHVLAFLAVYNFAKHLKSLRWRTPYLTLCDAWDADPRPFKFNPHHLIPGPHT